jgi:hypothetical protein
MNKRIALAHPFTMHDKHVDSLEIKEPNGALVVRLGLPRILVVNQSGSGYWIEQPGVIESYLNQIIVHESGAAVLNAMSLQDALAVKAALFGFFDAAQAKATPE